MQVASIRSSLLENPCPGHIKHERQDNLTLSLHLVKSYDAITMNCRIIFFTPQSSSLLSGYIAAVYSYNNTQRTKADQCLFDFQVSFVEYFSPWTMLQAFQGNLGTCAWYARHAPHTLMEYDHCCQVSSRFLGQLEKFLQNTEKLCIVM